MNIFLTTNSDTHVMYMLTMIVDLYCYIRMPIHICSPYM